MESSSSGMFGVPSSATIRPPRPSPVTPPRGQAPQAQGDSSYNARLQYLNDQVGRIVGQRGTEADVIRFLQAEGVDLPNVTIAETPNAAPSKPKVPGIIAGVSLEMLQGATFGTADDAIGSIVGLVNGSGAQAGRDAYRAQLHAFEKAHPVVSTVAQIGGGLATAALAPELGVAKLVSGGKTLGTLGRIGAAAAEGALGGAAYGAGDAEGGLSERARGALIGGAAGAVLSGGLSGAAKVVTAGPGVAGAVGGMTGSLAGGVPGAIAGSLIGAGVGKVGQAVRETAGTVLEKAANRVSRPSWAGTLRSLVPAEGTPSVQAVNVLRRAFEADGIAPERAIAEIERRAAAGLPTTAIDLGGPNVLALYHDVAAMRNPESQAMVEKLLSTANTGAQRVLSSAARTLKVGAENAYDAADKILADRIATSRPLYAQSYQLEVPVTPEIRQAMRNPWFQKLWERGRTTALETDNAGTASEGALTVPPLRIVEEAGAVPGFAGMSAEQVIAEAQARAARRARGEPVSAGQPIAPSAALRPGDIANETLPVRGLDMLQRALRQVIREKGTLGGGPEGKSILSREEGTALSVQIGKLLDHVSEQVEVFGKARATYKEASDLLDATSLGKGGMRPYGKPGQPRPSLGPRFSRKPPQVVAKEIASLSTDALKTQYRLGALQDLAELMHGARANASNVVESVFGSNPQQQSLMEQRMRALFSDAGDANEFMARVRGEAALSERIGGVARARSGTASQQLEEAEGPHMYRGVGVMYAPVATALRTFTERSRKEFAERLSNELTSIGVKGLNGSDELIALFEQLGHTAPPHRQALAVVGGAQAARIVQ